MKNKLKILFKEILIFFKESFNHNLDNNNLKIETNRNVNENENDYR